MKIANSVAKEFAWGADEQDGFVLVDRSFHEERRWFNMDEIIIRHIETDAYYSFLAGVDGESGYTTLDDEPDEIELLRVYKHTKVITEWRATRPLG